MSSFNLVVLILQLACLDIFNEDVCPAHAGESSYCHGIFRSSCNFHCSSRRHCYKKRCSIRTVVVVEEVLFLLEEEEPLRRWHDTGTTRLACDPLAQT